MYDREPDRGQTTIDFGIGVSILLLGVAFVITMAPHLFLPFEEGQSADPLAADRIADHLAEDQLVGNDSTNRFDNDTAAGFLGRPDDTLSQEVGTGQHVNVTLGEMDGDGAFHRGDPVPDSSNQVTESRRVMVHEDETRWWLYVRVW